jgi:hypothetical protein
MADGRVSLGLRWFFLLLLAEVLLFGVIYLLRANGPERSDDDPPPSFSRVQSLNLQSLINAKGYSCPTTPRLRYRQRQSLGVVIIATCPQASGGPLSFEIDFKGHVRPF